MQNNSFGADWRHMSIGDGLYGDPLMPPAAGQAPADLFSPTAPQRPAFMVSDRPVSAPALLPTTPSAAPDIAISASLPVLTATTDATPPTISPVASALTAAATPIAAISPVGSGSDQALQANAARAVDGVSGGGIRIGILSDSFNVTGGYAADIADGALPAGVTVLKEGPSSGHDEGRAMAQLIHQIAPSAQIDFYTAFDGETDFAAGIQALAAAGCQVIVDDVTYLDEPFFQDGGAVQTAVEQVVAQGVSYFTAASNEGTNYVQRSFAGIATTLPGISGTYLAENFGSAARPNALESLTVAKGATVTLDLQWDQPFANIGTGHAAADSLGMVLYDAAGHIVAYAMNDQVGGNPDQILQYTNTSGTTGLTLAIVTNGGAVAPGQFKVIAYGSGITINDRYAGIGSGTTIGHEMVADANVVGAVNYANTPQFGGDGTVESFSSAGSAGLLFDASGNRISGSAGGGVSFLAPDGSATSVYSPFYGTSAAAPNAAAVAALMLQANPSLTPAAVTNILEQTAVAARGPAGAVGAGLIDAAAAVQMASLSGASLSGAITAGSGLTGSDTATIAAGLLATAAPANPVAASASVGAPNFSASLADPAGTLGLAQAAALSTGQSFAMLAGWDPTTIGG